MDFKNFLPKRDQESEYYWSLIIEPGWVSASIWKILEKNAHVFLTTSPSAWELDDELVNAADSVLSGAIQNFPEESHEPSKTVFGVTPSWVAGGEIKEEYLEKIKKVCAELSLMPVGFVVIPEAIANLKKSEEGSPLNAIVVGVYKDSIEVSVFRLGSLLGTTLVTRSVTLIDDCVEGLTRFASGEALPSRFIVYNGKESELEEYRQMLLAVNWEDYEGLKFLHTPKVEVIDEKSKLYAVSLAGGAEIADATKLKIDEVKKEIPPVNLEEKKVVTEEDEEVSPEDLGFALEKDISQEDLSETQTPEIIEKPDKKNEQSEENSISEENVANVKNVNFKNFSLGSIKRFNPFSLLSKIPKVTFGSGKKPIIVGISFLLILIAGGFGFWWFYPKATVSVYVSPQNLNEKISVTVDLAESSPDFSNGILPGKKLAANVDGEQTKDTTGTKTVGDKAKGQVTLYRVGSEINLSAGTVLAGPDNLKFTLDDAVTVASGSAGSAGETAANVTAVDIGAQYNLAGGASFSVGNYSTDGIEAKNGSNSFSGGSSREITAVSSDDQEDLLADLTTELKQKGSSQLTKGLSQEDYFIENSLSASPSSKTFSNKIGDEASTLKLSLTLQVDGITLNKAELVDFAREKLKSKIPQGFVLRGEQVDFDFQLKDTQKDKYVFDLRISANLLPEVDIEKISGSIVGRYPSVALSTLEKEVPGFTRAEIKIKPILPGRLKTLPHIMKNIEIELVAEK